MGNAGSLMSYRRRSKMATEMRADNARLQTRIQQLCDEASKLRAEMKEIALSSDHGRVADTQTESVKQEEMCPLPAIDTK